MTTAALHDHIDPAILQTRWPLERVLFALAGSMTLISAALAVLISSWFLLLTAFRRRRPVALRALRRMPGVADLATRVFAALRYLPAPGGPPMSTITVPRAVRPAEPPIRVQDARGADRTPWALHRHALSHRAHRLARSRACARLPRAPGRDGSLRRRLGSERIAVGAGPQAGRTRLRRPGQLRPDDGRPFPDADGQRPGLQVGHSAGRTDAAR